MSSFFLIAATLVLVSLFHCNDAFHEAARIRRPGLLTRRPGLLVQRRLCISGVSACALHLSSSDSDGQGDEAEEEEEEDEELISFSQQTEFFNRVGALGMGAGE